MGTRAKEEAMKISTRLEALDILLIQETKLEDTTFLQASKKNWIKMERMQYLPVEHREDLDCSGTQISFH